MRRLLFLNGIKAFEAAARAGSFAAAGLELSVSAAAVSRMVHILEERLGVALFERKANKLLLTQAGRAYQSGLTPIFDALASLTAQVTAPSGVRVLTIGVGHTFAMRWLIPRLSEFRNEEPDIEVRFTTGGASVPFGEDWSCGIKLGTGDWPGLVAEPLFAGDLTPVCVPPARFQPEAAGGPQRPQPDSRRAFARGLADLAEGLRPYKDQRARPGVPVLRPGTPGRCRRARHRDGHPALYRRRSRRRPAGGTIRPLGAQGHALVPALPQLPDRAARLCRLPPLDHARGVGTCRPSRPANRPQLGAELGWLPKKPGACERLHIPESANVVP
ncbi:DNA-binding transcriptional LysR family regulator [Bradyrhizobium sp. LM3.6]